MSNGARRMTVEEFFHCYHPSEITQSKGMYSFVPRSPLLRLVCDTFDSNRNWKSRYFFIQGDEWMCHPGDQEYMPVDKTLALCPRPVCIHLYYAFTSWCLLCLIFYPSLIVARDRPEVTLKEWSFLENIFTTTKLSERSWTKLVTLDILHWYCDSPEPTEAACRYNKQMRKQKSVAQYLDFFLCFLVSYLTPFIHPSLCRNGRKQEKSLYQAASYC